MYKLQPEMAEELRLTDRKIYTDSPDYLEDSENIITVGDICTIKIHEQVRTPNLSIVDLKTKRNKSLTNKQKKVIGNIGDKVVNVISKAGTISKELWNAIKKSIDSTESVRIVVEGEEDLATLAAISLSKIGAKVIYGMPNKGMVVVDVNQHSKMRVDALLERMLVK